MKLKEYIKPAMETVPVAFESGILAASGVSDGDSPSDVYSGEDVTYSKPNKGLWGIGDDSE